MWRLGPKIGIFLGIFLTLNLVAISTTFAESQSGFHCSQGQFQCGNQKCILKRWRCDGEDDCGDKSDEAGCVPRTCRSDQFRCANGKCIQSAWKCDREDDCKDGLRSDELNCGNVTCGPNQFKCTNGKCISNTWKCDQQDDCGDNSDEDPTTTCLSVSRTCSANQFTCSNGDCISSGWVCDGDDDCGDGSDEQQSLCASKTCRKNEFTCLGSRKKCIPMRWKCDGDPDCPDRSDENGCKADGSPVRRACAPGMFKCRNGECVLGHWRCDGENDCTDASDEKGCPRSNCTSSEFACANGHCIPSGKRCNGIVDCPDRSDENGCSTPAPCSADEFKCTSTGVCIPKSKVCNAVKDCRHGEDEPLKCGIDECKDHNGHCSQICNDLPMGFSCSCRPGYTLSGLRMCVDVDECAVYGMCSQLCQNNKGSYKCSCHPGYTLDADKKTCRASTPLPSLIYSSQFSIRNMSITGESSSAVTTGRKGVVGLDVDYKTSMMYWTDAKAKMIHRARLDGTGSVEDIVSDVKVPDDITVDWIGRKIYWTDGEQDMVEVSELDGNNRMTLYSSGLDEPRAIAVDPFEGYVYWTDWGYNARIERGGMDGDASTRTTIITGNIGWPNGLTIDYTIKRLYWVDARLKKIESCTYDGSDRRLIANIAPEHPFAISVFENYLYYTDWYRREKAIRKINKFTGKERGIVKRVLWPHMDIQVLHPLKQPNGTNRCGNNNGGCSHLCLLAIAPRTFTCRCPNGMNVSSDGKTCVGIPITGQPTQPPTQSTASKPLTTVTTASPTSSPSKSNHVITKPSKAVPTEMKSTSVKPTLSAGGNGGVVAKREGNKDSSSGSGTVTKVVVPVVVVIVLIAILVGVGVWYWRSRCGYHKASTISYYKDMSTKPLEEDFDDNETTKVFDDGGPRCKVEFA